MSQPPPVPSNRPRTAHRVIEDIQARMERGAREYGTALQAHNGRRALLDLYEELLDGAHYVKQRLDEEDQTLRDVVGDQAVRSTLADIYTRVRVVQESAGQINRQALEKRYIDDLSYMRMIVESLLTELVSAKAVPPPPPKGTEVALYQYGCAGNGEPLDVGDDYDQNWVDRWVDDPSSLVQGYYPMYRPLYGGQWYRVDPGSPPEQPVSSEWGEEAPEPTRDDGRAPKGLPGEGAE